MATEQALNILKGMQADRESFRKLGLTFEEKAFYDILIHLRDKNNFVYGEDREVDGIVVNEKCRSLALTFFFRQYGPCALLFVFRQRLGQEHDDYLLFFAAHPL